MIGEFESSSDWMNEFSAWKRKVVQKKYPQKGFRDIVKSVTSPDSLSAKFSGAATKADETKSGDGK